MATRYKLIHGGKKLSDLSSTTSAELAGVISDETGSGKLVFDTAPVFPTSIQAATIELNHATDTTLSRSAAGVIAVEGVVIPSISSTDTLTNKTLGTVILGEVSFKLDAVLSADEKWSGITIAGTAGATLAIGDVCYLDVTAGKWKLVDGILDGTDIGFKAQLGICVLAGADTEATEMLTYGKIRSAKFPAFTVGAPVYLADTAGTLVVAQPSTTNFCIRIVGFSITAEDLLFNAENSYIVKV